MSFVDTRKWFENERKVMNETNDCTVVAFATVFNTEYGKAWNFLRTQVGRQSRKGLLHSLTCLIPTKLVKTRYAVGPYSRKNRITVKQFCEKHPEGRYFVCSRGHAFAIIDGVVHDFKHGPRRQIVYAFRVYLD